MPELLIIIIFCPLTLMAIGLSTVAKPPAPVILVIDSLGPYKDRFNRLGARPHVFAYLLEALMESRIIKTHHPVVDILVSLFPSL